MASKSRGTRSSRRGRLKVGLAALALVALGAMPAAASASNSYLTNSSIADYAERHWSEGSRGGQCMKFVHDVLFGASGGRISTSAYTYGYQGTFKANGGTLVASPNSAVRGDLIQITPAGTSDSWKGPEHAPLHTAIVLENLKNGNFKVIDSNYGYDERVRRHAFNPYAMAQRQGGGTVKIWRMGSIPAPPTPTPPPSTPPKAPSTPPPPAQHIYHVHNTCADHSCGLLVETAPGSHYGGRVIGTLSDGTAVNVHCQTVGGMVTGGEGSNDVWDQIDYGGGIGYVADLYLDTPGGETPQAHRHFTPSIPKC